MDLGPFELKIGTPVTLAPGNAVTYFGFSRFFIFELGARSGHTSDKGIDERTGRTSNAAY